MARVSLDAKENVPPTKREDSGTESSGGAPSSGRRAPQPQPPQQAHNKSDERLARENPSPKARKQALRKGKSATETSVQVEIPGRSAGIAEDPATPERTVSPARERSVPAAVLNPHAVLSLMNEISQHTGASGLSEMIQELQASVLQYAKDAAEQVAILQTEVSDRNAVIKELEDENTVLHEELEQQGVEADADDNGSSVYDSPRAQIGSAFVQRQASTRIALLKKQNSSPLISPKLLSPTRGFLARTPGSITPGPPERDYYTRSSERSEYDSSEGHSAEEAGSASGGESILSTSEPNEGCSEAKVDTPRTRRKRAIRRRRKRKGKSVEASQDSEDEEDGAGKDADSGSGDVEGSSTRKEETGGDAKVDQATSDEEASYSKKSGEDFESRSASVSDEEEEEDGEDREEDEYSEESYADVFPYEENIFALNHRYIFIERVVVTVSLRDLCISLRLIPQRVAQSDIAVYKALDRLTDEVVAVKIVNDYDGVCPALREIFAAHDLACA